MFLEETKDLFGSGISGCFKEKYRSRRVVKALKARGSKLKLVVRNNISLESIKMLVNWGLVGGFMHKFVKLADFQWSEKAKREKFLGYSTALFVLCIGWMGWKRFGSSKGYMDDQILEMNME